MRDRPLARKLTFLCVALLCIGAIVAVSATILSHANKQYGPWEWNGEVVTRTTETFTEDEVARYIACREDIHAGYNHGTTVPTDEEVVLLWKVARERHGFESEEEFGELGSRIWIAVAGEGQSREIGPDRRYTKVRTLPPPGNVEIVRLDRWAGKLRELCHLTPR